METINYSVVSFFLASSLMLGFLGYKFRQHKDRAVAHFGNGLMLVFLAFIIWTIIVAIHPENMNVWVSIGVAPFFLSFILFLLAATSNVKIKYKMPLYLIDAGILATFVVLRFFVFESDPGFTENGYFAFNVDPVVLYFYALITAFNFIPAVYVVGRLIKHDVLRIGVELGLTLVGVGLIIMITSQDEDLQFLNGTAIIIGLIAASAAVAKYPLNKHIK